MHALISPHRELLTSDNANFNRPYADAYDATYRDKDYAAECDFLEAAFRRFGDRAVRTVIDLGCGTGGHAIPLAQRGYEVVGVDRAPRMIDIARTKAQAAGDSGAVCFEVADICSVNLQRTFDAAVCMFAVLGYQTTNDALFAALRSTRHHLDMHGLFVFDVWYGPAVLSQKPRDRVKIVTDGGDRVIRLACVSTRPGRNIVEVSLRVLRLRGDRLVEETEEVHPMRYFFRPEMEFFLSQAGFDLVEFCAFGKPGAIPDDTTWNVSIVARAV